MDYENTKQAEDGTERERALKNRARAVLTEFITRTGVTDPERMVNAILTGVDPEPSATVDHKDHIIRVLREHIAGLSGELRHWHGEARALQTQRDQVIGVNHDLREDLRRATSMLGTDADCSTLLKELSQYRGSTRPHSPSTDDGAAFDHVMGIERKANPNLKPLTE